MKEIDLSQSNINFKDLLEAMLSEGAKVTFSASGFSMFPFIVEGDLLTISALEGAGLKVGSVVAFKRPQEKSVVVHRIVGRTKDSFLLKGDNVSGPDGYLTRSDLLGFVSKVERRGKRVRLGLGQEGMIIALLSRAGIIYHLVHGGLKVMPRSLRKFIKRKVLGVAEDRA